MDDYSHAIEVSRERADEGRDFDPEIFDLMEGNGYQSRINDGQPSSS